MSWLRGNGFPDFTYLIEIRELSDEEAFRLADAENRHRKDLSDYERALDYLYALQTIYNGSQKNMAKVLGVKSSWLSRYLDLAKLPKMIVQAFPQKTDILPGHAKRLKKILSTDEGNRAAIKIAKKIALSNEELTVKEVMTLLTCVGQKSLLKSYQTDTGEVIFTMVRKGRRLRLDVEISNIRISDNEIISAISGVIKGIRKEVIVT